MSMNQKPRSVVQIVQFYFDGLYISPSMSYDYMSINS